jgi:hypothetical protein
MREIWTSGVTSFGVDRWFMRRHSGTAVIGNVKWLGASEGRAQWQCLLVIARPTAVSRFTLNNQHRTKKFTCRLFAEQILSNSVMLDFRLPPRRKSELGSFCVLLSVESVRPLKMGPIDCPEKSVRKYHFTAIYGTMARIGTVYFTTPSYVL